jgi:predicted kinase
MAGLPGSGKSTVAARLAQETDGVVLSMDQVRAALFPALVLDHSAAENEISMDASFAAAAYIRKTFPQHPVIIDGRTFLRSYQVHDVLALAASLEESPGIIKCVCSDEVARQRLEHDLAEGTHPARNRAYGLYLAVKEKAEAIQVPHLILDTGELSMEDCVQRCLEYLRVSRDGAS